MYRSKCSNAWVLTLEKCACEGAAMPSVMVSWISARSGWGHKPLESLSKSCVANGTSRGPELLIFTIRDFVKGDGVRFGDNAEKLAATLLGDINRIWDSIFKPDA